MLGSLFFIGEADESRKNLVDHLKMGIDITVKLDFKLPKLLLSASLIILKI
jgi:hypothetical protein